MPRLFLKGAALLVGLGFPACAQTRGAVPAPVPFVLPAGAGAAPSAPQPLPLLPGPALGLPAAAALPSGIFPAAGSPWTAAAPPAPRAAAPAPEAGGTRVIRARAAAMRASDPEESGPRTRLDLLLELARRRDPAAALAAAADGSAPVEAPLTGEEQGAVGALLEAAPAALLRAWSGTPPRSEPEPAEWEASLEAAAREALEAPVVFGEPRAVFAVSGPPGSGQDRYLTLLGRRLFGEDRRRIHAVEGSRDGKQLRSTLFGDSARGEGLVTQLARLGGLLIVDDGDEFPHDAARALVLGELSDAGGKRVDLSSLVVGLIIDRMDAIRLPTGLAPKLQWIDLPRVARWQQLERELAPAPPAVSDRVGFASRLLPLLRSLRTLPQVGDFFAGRRATPLGARPEAAPLWPSIARSVAAAHPKLPPISEGAWRASFVRILRSHPDLGIDLALAASLAELVPVDRQSLAEEFSRGRHDPAFQTELLDTGEVFEVSRSGEEDYAATENGVYVRAGRTWVNRGVSPLGTLRQLQHTHGLYLAVTDRGVYARRASAGSSLSALFAEPERWRRVAVPEAHKGVSAAIVEGTLYVGTDSGLYSHDGRGWTREDLGAGRRAVRYVDTFGELLLAYASDGVYLHFDRRWTRLGEFGARRPGRLFGTEVIGSLDGLRAKKGMSPLPPELHGSRAADAFETPWGAYLSAPYNGGLWSVDSSRKPGDWRAEIASDLEDAVRVEEQDARGEKDDDLTDEKGRTIFQGV